jgi:DNA-binding transcriptional LysR family regulator
LSQFQRVPLKALEGHPMVLFPRRVTPGLHDAITGLCRNQGVTLNVVHEVDSMVGSLTLVSAGLGVAFCTRGLQRLWHDVTFRPIRESAVIEQGICHRHDAQSPVLETFLRVVRHVVHRQTDRARVRSVS